MSVKRPTLVEWVSLNLKVGALSFGGAGRSLIYHESVVDRFQWMTEDEFREVFTLAQVLPGPNLVNLSVYLGYRLHGIFATIVGVLALGLPGALMAVLVISFLDLKNFHVATVFQGFSLGSIAIFCVFLSRIIPGIKTTVGRKSLTPSKLAARILITAAVACAVFMQTPLLWILLVGLPLSVLIEFLT